MKPLYRLKIKPSSPWATPWDADTVLGHLCWTVLYHEGEDRLRDLLDRYRASRPPFVVSDACPGNLWPAPISLNLLPADPATLKAWKSIRFVTGDELRTIASGRSPAPQALVDLPPKDRNFIPAERLHVRIDRQTGTVGEKGSASLHPRSFYRLPECWKYISLYVRAEDSECLEHLVRLLTLLSRSGFGKRKSIGYGQFELVGAPEEIHDAPCPANPNAILALGKFTPALADPTEGFWQIDLKCPKFGETRAADGAPFKKPFLTLLRGSVFKTDRPAERWFLGRAVENLSLAVEKPVLQLVFCPTLETAIHSSP